MLPRIQILIAITLMFYGCGRNGTRNVVSGKGQAVHLYSNIFGDKYSALGEVLKNYKDSIETKLWYYTYLDTSLVLFRNYLNGLPAGKWQFVLNNGTDLSSLWSPYENKTTACRFSLPFSYKETTIDSSIFKLAIFNDSIGKISIVVNKSDTIIKNEKLAQFGPDSESGIRKQGYTFKSIRKEIEKKGNSFFLDEYFMKDSLNKDVKLYHLYGYSPSHKFIEFTLFHDGANEALVKIIYNMMTTNLYLYGQRFFNAHFD